MGEARREGEARRRGEKASCIYNPPPHDTANLGVAVNLGDRVRVARRNLKGELHTRKKRKQYIGGGSRLSEMSVNNGSKEKKKT